MNTSAAANANVNAMGTPKKGWKLPPSIYPPFDMTEYMEHAKAKAQQQADAGKPCICERSANSFYCTACDGFFYGRISQTCERHPNTMFLLDTPRCVHCQSGTYMLHPVDIDEKTVQAINDAKQTKKIGYTDMQLN